MTLGEFRKHLQALSKLIIKLPDGGVIPEHFHVTEVGLITKKYIDCGGVKRKEQYVSLQVWVAGDIDHRLTPAKLSKIIEVSGNFIHNDSIPLYVEYQDVTISRRNIIFAGTFFSLQPVFTGCLAEDTCGISPSQLTPRK